LQLQTPSLFWEMLTYYDSLLLQCGIPGGGAVIDLNLQDVVFGQKTMAGSIVGGRADMMEMLQFCGDKGVEPMVEVMKLSQVGCGFRAQGFIALHAPLMSG
jgi:D-arabinose 1-dehydrogenase-like Zn-dependent alcohol dehydrogenase